MNKGFTLVELIAVVTILGLLAIITTPAYDTISKNIKSQNYESKINTIKKQTLSYAEKYLKDKVYPKLDISGDIPTNGSGEKIYETNYYCFTVEYLIQNGIISSDDEKDELLENNETGDRYKGKYELIKIYYDNGKLKLLALSKEDEGYDDSDKECTYCDNVIGGCIS